MEQYNPYDHADPITVRERLLVTQETIQDLKDTRYIIPGLFAEAHVHVIIAKPNTGKTALLTHLCPEMATDYEIDYFNFDGNAADIKRQFEGSVGLSGYNILNASLGRVTMPEIISLLEWYSIQKNMHSRVLILDTLKQFCNVIQKDQIKPFMQLLRRISLTGAAVIVLGHANKALDVNGELVFEGTNDVESECDELSYMYYSKHEDKGLQLISLIPHKTRGDFERQSWQMDLGTRKILAIEYVDIKEEWHDIKIKVSKGQIRANLLYQIVSKECKVPDIWHNKLTACSETFLARVEGLDVEGSKVRALNRALEANDRIQKRGNEIMFSL